MKSSVAIASLLLPLLVAAMALGQAPLQKANADDLRQAAKPDGDSASRVPAEQSDLPADLKPDWEMQDDLMSMRSNSLFMKGKFEEYRALQQERLAFLVNHAPPKASYDRLKRLESSIQEAEMFAKLSESEFDEFLRVRKLIDVAILLTRREKYEAAEHEFTAALEVCDRLFGPNSSWGAMLRQFLANVNRNMRKFDEALEFSKQSEQLRLALHGEQHPEYVAALGGLGVAFVSTQEFDKAEKCLRHCLKIETAIYDDRTRSSYVTWQIVLSRVLVEKKQVEEGQKLINEASAVAGPRESLNDDWAATSAFCHSVQAEIDIANSKYEAANQQVRKAVAIYEKVRPRGSKDIIQSLESQIAVLEKLGREEELADVQAKLDLHRLYQQLP